MEGLLKMKESIQPALARISHCARKIRKTVALRLQQGDGPFSDGQDMLFEWGKVHAF